MTPVKHAAGCLWSSKESSDFGDFGHQKEHHLRLQVTNSAGIPGVGGFPKLCALQGVLFRHGSAYCMGKPHKNRQVFSTLLQMVILQLEYTDITIYTQLIGSHNIPRFCFRMTHRHRYKKPKDLQRPPEMMMDPTKEANKANNCGPTYQVCKFFSD